MAQTFRFDESGYEIELGKYARQANGAVWFKQGGTVLLATVVSAPSKEFPGFLPLSVDYREKFSAAGKIPGGYYKREGKVTDHEVLVARMADRAIRPLFPANYFDQLQVVVTVYSVDKEHAPRTLALLASSIALTISNIPFMGPVGVVEMARVNGTWVVNPKFSDSQAADANIIVAGTAEGISMVEGNSNEMSEKEFLDVLFQAHSEIKKVVAWQEAIRKEAGVEKAAIEDTYHWKTWEDRIDQFLNDEHVKHMYIEDKIERNEYMKKIRADFTKQYENELTESQIPEKVIDYIFDDVLKNKLTERIFTLNKRVDGRTVDTVRQITTDIGMLPDVHGSGLFTRGRTQALASVTLGGGQDAQRIETLMEDIEETFMLHYNFPGFATGEVKPMRAPARREVGHGNLAASAFKYVLPEKDVFPYTIRVVVDILESDGSSSMATACSTTLGLMQAGVPIKKMIGGVAMGLLKSKNGDFKVISDITGFEDAFGLMDFKVVGTEQGITAIQMDIKYKGGLERAVFDQALAQARDSRLHIINEMKKTISKPEPLSPLVPKVTLLKIQTDKIGTIIGSGGKTIKEIIEKTGTEIDIEPDGTVKIFGAPGAKTEKAIEWIKVLAGQITPGSIYDGIIRKIADFGMFVELVPGQDGLVHVSNIPRDLQRVYNKQYKVGDQVKVQIVDYDEVTGRISLRLLIDKS